MPGAASGDATVPVGLSFLYNYVALAIRGYIRQLCCLRLIVLEWVLRPEHLAFILVYSL